MINSLKLKIAIPKKKAKRSHKITYDVTSLPNEIWKDISGYKGLYEISNLGRVKHLAFISDNKRDAFANKVFICSTKFSKGYIQVHLKDEFGYRKLWYVHKLVALAFIPNPNGYNHINHKDENKENNKAENLEWCTTLYNNTYNNRHIKAGVKQRRYIKIYKSVKNEKVLIDTIKISDITKYRLSYQFVTKYLDIDNFVWSRANQCYLKFESI